MLYNRSMIETPLPLTVDRGRRAWLLAQHHFWTGGRRCGPSRGWKASSRPTTGRNAPCDQPYDGAQAALARTASPAVAVPNGSWPSWRPVGSKGGHCWASSRRQPRPGRGDARRLPLRRRRDPGGGPVSV